MVVIIVIIVMVLMVGEIAFIDSEVKLIHRVESDLVNTPLDAFI